MPEVVIDSVRYYAHEITSHASAIRRGLLVACWGRTDGMSDAEIMKEWDIQKLKVLVSPYEIKGYEGQRQTIDEVVSAIMAAGAVV